MESKRQTEQDSTPKVQPLTQADAKRILESLRYQDWPQYANFFPHFILNPNHPTNARFFFEIVFPRMKLRAEEAGPFFLNFPDMNALPPLENAIPIFIPTGVFGIPFHELPENQLLVGPAGSGKTSFLAYLLLWLVQSGATIILIERKRTEAVNRRAFWDLGLPVTVWTSDLHFCPYQPPDGIDERMWARIVTETTAQIMGIIWSTNELLDVVMELVKKP